MQFALLPSVLMLMCCIVGRVLTLLARVLALLARVLALLARVLALLARVLALLARVLALLARMQPACAVLPVGAESCVVLYPNPCKPHHILQ